MSTQSIKLEDGKYHFLVTEQKLVCERYGDEWREFIGDKAVHALFDHAIELQRLLDSCQAGRSKPKITCIETGNTYSEYRCEGCGETWVEQMEDYVKHTCKPREEDRRDHYEDRPGKTMRDAENRRTPVHPVPPTLGRLISMALRFRHDFGLLSQVHQAGMISQMRQVYEEATGAGFYSADREQNYLALLKKDET